MSIELELLRTFRTSGDAAAMERLVGRTRSRLLRIARRIGSPQDAEDTVQAAYHALLRKADLQNGASVIGWLVTTTVRIAYRRKAVALRATTIAEQLARPGSGSRPDAQPWHRVGTAERDHLVRAAIHRLPPNYRDVVVLHHLHELPVRDVARLLDVPVATVKTRVQRARLLLRARLSPALLHVALVPFWMAGDALQTKTLLTFTGVMMKNHTAAVAIGAAFAVGLGIGGAGAAALNDGPPPRSDEELVALIEGVVSTRDSSPRDRAVDEAPERNATPERERVTEPIYVPPTESGGDGDEDEYVEPELPGRPLTVSQHREVSRELLSFRQKAIKYDLKYTSGPNGPVVPPDPERAKRFPDAKVWPGTLGYIETDPDQYRVAASASDFDGSRYEGGTVFTSPLDSAIASTTSQSLVFDRGIASDGMVTLTGYSSIDCQGDMAGDILVDSYSTVLIGGDCSGQIKSTSYVQVVIEGEMTGTFDSSSYSEVYFMGGFSGTIKTTSTCKVYIGGYTPAAALEGLPVYCRVMLEDSDLEPGDHVVGKARVKVLGGDE